MGPLPLLVGVTRCDDEGDACAPPLLLKLPLGLKGIERRAFIAFGPIVRLARVRGVSAEEGRGDRVSIALLR